MRRATDAQPPGPRRRGANGVQSRFRAGGEASGGNLEGQHWERVMHTKLTQWRYMHLVALEELSQSERNACAELADLGAVLEAATTRLHALEGTLSDAHALRAREHFADRAAPSLALLGLGLASAAPAHEEVCAALVAALRRLRTPAGAVADPAKLPAALAKYRAAAEKFVAAATRSHASDAAAVAQSLAQLEKVAVTMQQDALAAAAKEVSDAADAIDEERAKRATRIIANEEAAAGSRDGSSRQLGRRLSERSRGQSSDKAVSVA